jgi:hypothetical protein
VLVERAGREIAVDLGDSQVVCVQIECGHGVILG